MLETWRVDLLPSPPSAGPTGGAASTSLELPLVYKQGILLFRALLAATRVLPSYKLAKQLRKGKSGLASGLRIGCRLSQTSPADSASSRSRSLYNREYGLYDPLTPASASSSAAAPSSASVGSFSFAPVSTPSGNIAMHVDYRKQADFGVEDKEALLSSRFLNEDFFKPSIQPSSSPIPSRDHQQMSAPQSRSQEQYGQQQQQQRLPRYHASPLSGGRTQPAQSSSPIPSSRLSQDAPASSLRYTGSGSGPNTAPLPATDVQEGAFVLSRQSSVSSLKGKGVPVPSPTARRPPLANIYRSSPSSGSGHGVAVGAQASPQPIPSTSAAAGAGPFSTSHRTYSGSSGFGPSSSLRYTSLQPQRTAPSDEDSPQAEPSSLSSSRGGLPRYTSHRYARSTSSVGSSESMPVSSSPAFGPESLGRRSRLSSSYLRGEAAKPSSLHSQPQPATSQQSAATPEDSEDINSFLQMIDSRPQLRSANTTKTPQALASEADAQLKALAGSLAKLPSAEATSSLQCQAIAEEASTAAVSPEAMNRSSKRRSFEGPQPSSFPRYIQPQERRSTKVQTGFHMHSTSTSPEPAPPRPPPLLSRYSSSRTMSTAPSLSQPPSAPPQVTSMAQTEDTPPSPSFPEDEGPVGRLDMSFEGEERPVTRKESSEHVPRSDMISIHRGGRSKPTSMDREYSRRATFSAALAKHDTCPGGVASGGSRTARGASHGRGSGSSSSASSFHSDVS